MQECCRTRVGRWSVHHLGGRRVYWLAALALLTKGTGTSAPRCGGFQWESAKGIDLRSRAPLDPVSVLLRDRGRPPTQYLQV